MSDERVYPYFDDRGVADDSNFRSYLEYRIIKSCRTLNAEYMAVFFLSGTRHPIHLATGKAFVRHDDRRTTKEEAIEKAKENGRRAIRAKYGLLPGSQGSINDPLLWGENGPLRFNEYSYKWG